jgi:hypothetical protein
MSENRPWVRASALKVALLVLLMSFGPQARAEKLTECAADQFCFCVNSEMKDIIAKRVSDIRALIRGKRSDDKTIGYLSIPISSLEGSYFEVNVRVGAEVKERLEERFGPRFLWLLNSAASDFTLPKDASGADYMLMWTRVLQGDDGLGNDFDFFYFVGPSDFARHFSLDGKADMEKLDRYYEALAKTEVGLKSVDKVQFRKYYALRASTAFSYGAHDEWNIARAINARRRAQDGKKGIAQQLGLFFDGRAVSPGLFESATSSGNAGTCLP